MFYGEEEQRLQLKFMQAVTMDADGRFPTMSFAGSDWDWGQGQGSVNKITSPIDLNCQEYSSC